jgi:hypothetical protein
LRKRPIDFSVLRSPRHKLSYGDNSPSTPLSLVQVLSIDDSDESVDNEAQEADDNRRCDRCRRCSCMYARCASETSSWRLLRDGEERRKGRRKMRVTDENIVHMFIMEGVNDLDDDDDDSS